MIDYKKYIKQIYLSSQEKRERVVGASERFTVSAFDTEDKEVFIIWDQSLSEFSGNGLFQIFSK